MTITRVPGPRMRTRYWIIIATFLLVLVAAVIVLAPAGLPADVYARKTLMFGVTAATIVSGIYWVLSMGFAPALPGVEPSRKKIVRDVVTRGVSNTLSPVETDDARTFAATQIDTTPVQAIFALGIVVVSALQLGASTTGAGFGTSSQLLSWIVFVLLLGVLVALTLVQLRARIHSRSFLRTNPGSMRA